MGVVGRNTVLLLLAVANAVCFRQLKFFASVCVLLGMMESVEGVETMVSQALYSSMFRVSRIIVFYTSYLSRCSQFCFCKSINPYICTVPSHPIFIP